jgi:hypothetical protein
MKCEATKAMENARAALVSKHPSLGYLCFKLKWFPDSTSPTAWTDGVSVGFNPEFVLSLNNKGRQFLCAHEVGHPMLGHHLRRGDRDPAKWNIACDHVVNLILAAQGFSLLEGALIDYQFRGMAVEQVFNILFPPGHEDQEEDQDSTESGQNGDSSPDNGQEASEGQDDQEDGLEEKGGDSSGDDGEEEGEDQTEGSDSGDQGRSDGPKDTGQDGQESGDGPGEPTTEGTGQAEDVEPGKPGDVGEVRDFPGETSEDFDMEAEKWDGREH